MKRHKLPQVYTDSATQLLGARFLKKAKKGKLESPRDMFRRVAHWVAGADKNYTKDQKQIEKAQREFFDILFNLRFIPNTPTLLNAGQEGKTLSACFVLPIEDSLDSIYQTLSDAVQVQWKGGGTGFNFSKIRPKGDEAGGIPGVAAGPVHFLKTFSEALMGVRQGGKRGGANMGILNVDHPDILDFIHAKERDRTIMNFNLSVGITNEFMEALRDDENYALINPRNRKVVKKLSARRIFNDIVELAHRTGDPGIAFIDNIDEDNPTPKLGHIDATNPCGEQPLLPYESCNLGALNLRVHFDFRKKELDWRKLRKTVRIAVHFLDNVVDVNYYPVKKIENLTRFKNRKIGLGLMGFAEVLMLKEIPYDSEDALKYAEKVMAFIQKEGIKASQKLAKNRTTFPAYKGSVWEKQKLPVRNATITTIAPNGNTSIIGGSSGGIEPAYGLAYKVGGVEDGHYRATKVLFRENEAFKYLAKRYKFYSKDLVKKLAEGKSISEVNIPEKLRKILVTAHEIEPIWHLRMQSAFQKHVDNAISKTINFPNKASVDDVRKVFIEAYRLGLKGVTIYRDGSKEAQTYVSTKKGRLNVEGETEEKIKIVIASKNEVKINEIKNFIQENDGQYEISEDKFRLVKDREHVKKSDGQILIDSAKDRAKRVAEETGKIALADESAVVCEGLKYSLKGIEVDYFGKDGKYSKNLFEILKKHTAVKGLKANIYCVIVLYDPVNDRPLITEGRVPGKLVQSAKDRNKYYFIQKGLESFKSVPSKEKFRSFHHRYKALQKIFEKFTPYKEEELETNVTPNAYQVLERRALRKNDKGEVIETPEQLWKRIAKFIAKADLKYLKSRRQRKQLKKTEEKFFEAMNSLELVCGGALIWAGQGVKTFSKCFVLEIEDSIQSIFGTLRDNIEILRHGGGTGFNLSNIRSTYAIVGSTGENAAGPINYLKAYNQSQHTIKGRGGREMGSMAILNIDHPNIEEFIMCKDDPAELTHYNISVGVTEEFMEAMREDRDWDLVDPHDKKVYKTVKARKLFKKIAKQAWKTGDPGLVFLDEMRRKNTVPNLGEITATNVCGEQPLLPYESCNLANVDVSKMVKGFPYVEEGSPLNYRQAINKINWDRLREVVHTGMHFLDNMIDINTYPLEEIEEMTKKSRNAGLGIMGFADLLIKLGIPYQSEDALKMAERIMKFIQSEARAGSEVLGKERGDFPAFKKSKLAKKFKHMRNARVTTIAPTGTVSIVAGCNPGIEPIYALSYKRRNSMGGVEQSVVNEDFEAVARARGFYSDELMRKVGEGKSLDEIKDVPKDVKEVFATAHAVEPEWHVRIQAAFQKHIDSGVSKTINLPREAKVEDVEKVYQLAYELKCKGITVFRDGCKEGTIEVKVKSKSEKEEGKRALIETREKEETTQGVTTEIKTEQGKLSITINRDKHGVCEVIPRIGKSGGYSAAYTEAIGRLLSVGLLSGIKPEILVKEMKGIRSSAPTLNKGMIVYSIPDAIAKVLERFVKEKVDLPMFDEETEEKLEVELMKTDESPPPPRLWRAGRFKQIPMPVDQAHEEEESIKAEKYTNENHNGDLLECPDCGGDLEYAEGCVLCRGCGFSRCG